MEVGKDALRMQASRLHTNGDDYTAAVERLRERGGRWGDDGLFAEIEAAWVDCRQTVIEAVPGIGGTVNGVGDGMLAVPRNIDAGEDASAMQEPSAWQ
ncbi:hypothetical protein [Nonomuraea insulae]|uniref:Uncharacterized protein n=1 Tax=Nonomuraea insulae TaxID=1616787 RepID=A0ABW1CCF6_9ACTN